MTRTKRDELVLAKVLRRHVDYEVEMIQATGHFMGTLPVGSCERKAMLESFLVHSRNLIAFFDGKNAHANDVLAEDFFASRAEWEKIRDSIPPALEVRNRISKRLAHITYDRISEGDQDQYWDCKEISGALSDLWDRFTAAPAVRSVRARTAQASEPVGPRSETAPKGSTGQAAP